MSVQVHLLDLDTGIATVQTHERPEECVSIFTPWRAEIKVWGTKPEILVNQINGSHVISQDPGFVSTIGPLHSVDITYRRPHPFEHHSHEGSYLISVRNVGERWVHNLPHPGDRLDIELTETNPWGKHQAHVIKAFDGTLISATEVPYTHQDNETFFSALHAVFGGSMFPFRPSSHQLPPDFSRNEVWVAPSPPIKPRRLMRAKVHPSIDQE